jgi:hypothetical protein
MPTASFVSSHACGKLSHCHFQRKSKLMSQLGQKRQFDLLPATSGLPLTADLVSPARHVSNVPKRRPSAVRQECDLLDQLVRDAE